MPNIFCYWMFCINAWPSSIRSYDLELDEAQSEVLGPGEHLRVQFLTRDNRDDQTVLLPAPHLARQTEQVELHRLADVADLVSQCSIAGHHMWTWHEYDLTLNFVIRTLPSVLWTAPSWHQRPGTHPCPSLTGLDVIIIWLIDHWHIYKKIFMSANWWHNLVTCEDVTVVVVHLDIRLGTHSVSAEDRDGLTNYDIMGN